LLHWLFVDIPKKEAALPSAQFIDKRQNVTE